MIREAKSIPVSLKSRGKRYDAAEKGSIRQGAPFFLPLPHGRTAD